MFDKEYKVSWLSDFFHSFPHVDLTFQRVNSTFDPLDARYREALVFWAAIPVLWLLVTLLVFLVYFCYRCCQRDVEKKQRVPCLRWTMAILALLTCASVGVGFYGNEEANKGLNQFKNSVIDAEATVANIQKEIDYMDADLNGSVDHGLRSLQKIFRSHRLNETMKQKLNTLMTQAMSQVQEILDEVSSISVKSEIGDVDKIITQTETIGFYRWLSTLVFLCWMVLLCLLLLFGIGRSSKCTLLMFCAFGIFTMVLCWMSAGIHTGISVGGGDFCVDPDQYVEHLYQDPKDREVVHYYVKCNAAMSSNPYLNAIKAATENLRQSNQTLKEARSLADYLRIPRIDIQQFVDKVLHGMDATSSSLLHLTALVECTNLHKDYRDAIIGICSVGFPGLVFLLLSFILSGLLFTILVILASRAWRHFSRSESPRRIRPICSSSRKKAKKPKDVFSLSCIASSSVCSTTEVYKVTSHPDAGKGYLEVDEDDPFLPRGDNATSYYRYGDSLQSRPISVHEDGGASFTRQGRPPGTATVSGGASSGGPVTVGRDHHMSIQRRPTPPPAEAQPLNGGQDISLPTAPPQYNSYDYRSPTEVHHHMGDSPGAPMAHHDDYPTFGRESHA